MSGFRSADSEPQMFIRSIVVGQMCDVVPSIHHPDTDRFVPFVQPFSSWLTLDDDQALADLIHEQGFDHAHRGVAATASTFSAQRAPDLTLVPRRRPARPAIDPRIAKSIRIFKRLRAGLLEAPIRPAVDVRAPWQPFTDRGTAVSAVASTIADLIELIHRRPYDPPSARYLGLAARELDGDGRPTTMIAAAGTSVRGALAVARDHGYATETELPSSSSSPFPGALDAFDASVHKRRSGALVNLGRDSKSLLGWLTLRRPATVILAVGRKFLAPSGPDFVIDAEDPGVETFLHPALVVGYRLDVDSSAATWREFFEQRDEDKKMPIQYRIRNSANPHWGEGGHAWLTQAAMLDQATEAYGLFRNDDDEEKM